MSESKFVRFLPPRPSTQDIKKKFRRRDKFEWRTWTTQIENGFPATMMAIGQLKGRLRRREGGRNGEDESPIRTGFL